MARNNKRTTDERSPSFGFLADGHDRVFHDLALTAERVFPFDPSTTLLKLRQLAEAFAREAAAACSISFTRETSLLDLLRALESRRIIEGEVASLFHQLRKEGNRAAHDFEGSHQEGLDQLRLARKLAIWFHRTFGSPAKNWKPGEFVPPPDPTAKLRELSEALAQARAEAESAKEIARVESAHREEEAAARAKAEAEREEWEQFAVQIEQDSKAKLVSFEQRVEARASASQEPDEASKVLKNLVARASAAAADLDLNEQDTRVLIDQQLRAAGWEVDTRTLRHQLGARPEAGKFKAIAEYPTRTGPADYVLFDGLVPVGVVEAKRKAKNTRSSIEQAKRYSISIEIEAPLAAPRPYGAPDDFRGWATTSEKAAKGKPAYYRVPFLYATNGRPYLRQLESESGTWFLDARLPTNHARALADGWHSPKTLREMLAVDLRAADESLTKEPTDYLGLRDCQLRAIAAVEAAIAKDQRSILLAMATGTGKTRTTIGLLYRLLKAKRFRRILFLVDRSALGEQAQNAFKEMRLENMQTFTEIYEVKELADQIPEPETKVHVATVQGMVKRILYSSAEAVPIDRYDCIIVDESHRGYMLDREMSEGEQELRSFTDYISTYRRVLDHFDAVKVGLTATPALHTRDIFGDPVFAYSYREAVVDGFLIDHEPPVQIETKLAKSGIHFAKGSQVEKLLKHGKIELNVLPDELDFDVEQFNKQVITEGFNRVVCEELAKHLDPTGDAKTLVFCANDKHADLFVGLLKEVLEVHWGKIDDGAVQKITGSIDRPLEAIRRYKNEKLPNIAVTVDLLTTGIDVPAISNLVFVRRVRSRILYEQMLGRATRRCDEIGKEVFRIYDAVDLYSALESFTSMKPVVKEANVGIRQLVGELLAATGRVAADGGKKSKKPSEEALQELLDDVVAKLRRLARAAKRRAEKRDAASANVATLQFDSIDEVVEGLTGEKLEDLPSRLQQLGPAKVAEIFKSKPELVSVLETLSESDGGGEGAVISHHPDEVSGVSTGYGMSGEKPADYLDGFGRFVQENRNKLPALTVVLTRPRRLTREQLRGLRLKLDEAGYSENTLRAAWRDLKNEDIAATIIGFIRQRALGSPLIPYEERVDRAVRRVLGSRQWTAAEKKWLERIAQQLKKEVVVDRAAFETGAFKNAGGFKGVDKHLGGRLADILDELGDGIWEDAAVAAR